MSPLRIWVEDKEFGEDFSVDVAYVALAEAIRMSPIYGVFIEGLARSRWDGRFGQNAWDMAGDQQGYTKDAFRNSARRDFDSALAAVQWADADE